MTLQKLRSYTSTGVEVVRVFALKFAAIVLLASPCIAISLYRSDRFVTDAGASREFIFARRVAAIFVVHAEATVHVHRIPGRETGRAAVGAGVFTTIDADEALAARFSVRLGCIAAPISRPFSPAVLGWDARCAMAIARITTDWTGFCSQIVASKPGFPTRLAGEWISVAVLTGGA